MLKLLIPLLLILAPAPVQAKATISCHCFQDRSFDPQRAAAADPYFLATTQNSLLAAAFNIAKKDVVRAKMSGTSGEDLWVAHFLSSRTGISFDQWRAGRGDSGSWATAIADSKVPVLVLGPRVAKAVEQRLADEAVARAVVEDLLVHRAGTDPNVLATLRQHSATIQETILSVFLEAQTGQAALGQFEAVQSKNKTWGQLLDGSKIPPGEIETRIVRMLR